MFTGIIRHTGKIGSVRESGGGRYFQIDAPSDLLSRLEKGITSVALNGACHTVTNTASSGFSTYSSFETLEKTNLGELRPGDEVNLELPVTPTTLLDGHLVQGHCDGTGKLSGVTNKGDSRLLRFTAPPEIMRYLVEKDSIAVDGVSLTLFHIEGDSFEVAMIPATAEHTLLGKKRPGAKVNLEVNLFAKYAERFSGAKDARLLSKLAAWQ
jgi:riboflavin synthase